MTRNTDIQGQVLGTPIPTCHPEWVPNMLCSLDIQDGTLSILHFLDSTDCTVKPCTKQLHLTLAHKFYPHHQRTLEQLARAIQPSHTCQWTAALYSRDMRFVHYQVREAGLAGGLSQPFLLIASE